MVKGSTKTFSSVNLGVTYWLQGFSSTCPQSAANWHNVLFYIYFGKTYFYQLKLYQARTGISITSSREWLQNYKAS